MQLYTIEGNKLIWQWNGETLEISPWGQDSLRVRARMMGEVLDTDYALLPPQETNVQIQIEGEQASLTNGKIKVVITNQDWDKTGRLSFYNQKGELLLKEIGFQGALNLYARKHKPIIGGDSRLTVQFESDPREKLYGMGQYQQDILDLKGCNIELAHRNSQASVPFVLSSKGYGFLWHNPAIGKVSFGKNTTEWYAESTKQMDYWITVGDTPHAITENYAKATGTVPMMPEYGLGFWQCRLRYYNQEQLLEVAREYKRRNIPLDVIICDFFHWPKMGDFRFEEEFFPDPKAMVEELKVMGIELMVSVWPQIDLQSENFEEMKQKGYLVRPEMGVQVCMQFGGDSVFFDATNEKARQFVWDKCRANYYKDGIKLFWLDEAEPEYGRYDFDNYRYAMGPNVQIGNIYPQMFSKTFYEGVKAEGEKDIVNLVRCAWAGSQRYGALVWSGDIHCTYEDFKRQICAGIHMGIAGIPWWTTDIGGFHGGNPKDEGFRRLLVRWFQYGTFLPVMRLHGDRSPQITVKRKDGSQALFAGSENEVWSFGEEAYPILVKYIQLREAMRPYTRELMKEAHEKGTPLIRAMFYEYPHDAKCWEIGDQYMFGKDLLVAPISDATDERSVYLPQGETWVDAYTQKSYSGGQVVQCYAPLERIPLFVREGQQSELIKYIQILFNVDK